MSNVTDDVAFSDQACVVVDRAPEPPARQTVSSPGSMLLTVVARLQEQDDVESAASELAEAIRTMLPACSVAVGIVPRNRKSCRLLAISGVQRIDRRTDQARAIEAAMDEALARDGLTAAPTDDARPSLTHEGLNAMFRSRRAITVPLRLSSGRLIGAITAVGDEELASCGTDDLLRSAQSPIAGAFHLLMQRRQRPFHRHMRRTPRTTRLLLLLAVAVAILTGGLPVPYRVACDVELQPVTRRFVAAPHEGLLDKALREPGDLVSSGETLARMNARELRLQISSLQAQFEQAKKRREAALATGAGVEAQIARLEMRNVESELDLLRERENSLEIRSPIDGIVVSGDLERVEGAPLSTGQSLFEIAPLDEMIAEVRVPESDVAYVSVGRQVTLRLRAFPGRSFVGTIERLHPRSELIDNEAVFVAELRLQNGDGELRPGMSGRAKVTCSHRPLAWTLLHKPVESLAIRFGW